MGQVDSDSRKPYFIVRNELDSESVILRSYLEGSIQYQRQQETLIVWTDSQGKDLALSFQENEGCADLCDFIVRVQQENLSPLISLYYVLNAIHDPSGDMPREITELITGPITYPPEHPTRGSLDEILDIVTQGCNSLYTRYKILKYITEDTYLKKLLDLFHLCEQQRDLTCLHKLSEIFKVLVSYNEAHIFESIVARESTVLDFVGILEYDRDFPDFRACHRQHLLDVSSFKCVVDIPMPSNSSDDHLNIFKKDFYLNYLKNVVLARVIDDQASNILSGMIHSNQSEIIEFLKDSKANDNFLDRLFDVYNSSGRSLTTKRDGIRMLHQYVLVAKGLSVDQKPEFFGSLAKEEFLNLVKFALSDTDSSIRSVGTEILVTVIDQVVTLAQPFQKTNTHEIDEVENPAGHMIPHEKLGNNAQPEVFHAKFINNASLTLVLIELLLNDKDPGLKLQAYEALKTLLSSSRFMESGAFDLFPNPANEKHTPEDESVALEFFKSFYDIHSLKMFHSFVQLSKGIPSEQEQAATLMRREPHLFQFLCEIVIFCSQEHAILIFVPFITQKYLLEGILKVLTLKVSISLKLAVMRCIRGLIQLDDRRIVAHILEHNVLENYFDFFASVADENTMANSTCLNLLEMITSRYSSPNFKLLILYLQKHFLQFLKTKISYVSSGTELLRLADAYMDPQRDVTTTSVDLESENGNVHNPSSPIVHSLSSAEAASEDKQGSKRNLFENIAQETCKKAHT